MGYIKDKMPSNPAMRIGKSPSIIFAAALLLGVFGLGYAPRALSDAATGPDTTDSTTDNSTGIVTGVPGRGTISVNSRRGPFTYRLGLDLHITGPDNKALKITQVRAGDEATVYYYVRDGQLTVGRIVVLKRAAAAATGGK
jgi:hypothetical protein